VYNNIHNYAFLKLYIITDRVKHTTFSQNHQYHISVFTEYSDIMKVVEGGNDEIPNNILGKSYDIQLAGYSAAQMEERFYPQTNF
jgi:hypothetical protein